MMGRMGFEHGWARNSVLIVMLGMVVVGGVLAQAPKPLPPLRRQADIQQDWLKLRLERLLPTLMRRHGVAMWLIICREYNEDPAFFSLVSPTVFAARRRTIYVFYDRGPTQGLERLALGGGSNGGLYTIFRDPEASNRELMGGSQWALLRKLIEQRNPATIAVDISHTHAFSDGLSASERDSLLSALGSTWSSRIVHAENLALEYQSLRLPEMLPVYRNMMRIVHEIIGRAFSNEVITPGKTTTADVVWWMRQEVKDRGLGTWFQPSVNVQRSGLRSGGILSEGKSLVIERGDVLHCDFGIVAFRLATDTQHMGYVLRDGETEVPPGIKKALATTNRLQDLLMEQMRPARTGNEVLAATLTAMRANKIEGTIYTHPIGDRGHGAGPLIGLWDHQEGVPGRGDVLLLPNTWFSIELQATSPVPEWNNQPLRVAQEEDAVLGDDGLMHWVLKRQTAYHLIH